MTWMPRSCPLRPGDLVFTEVSVTVVVASMLFTRVWVDYSVFPAAARLRPSQEKYAFYELFTDCVVWQHDYM